MKTFMGCGPVSLLGSIVAFSGLFVACGSSERPPAAPGVVPPASQASAPPALPKAVPWSLVVAGADGVVAVDDRGRIVHRHSELPAEALRTGGGSTLWFLSAEGGALELRTISRSESRVVARIPRRFDLEHCAPSESPARPRRPNGPGAAVFLLCSDQ